MKKKIGIIALALTSALLLTGCGGSGAKKDDAKKCSESSRLRS